MDEPTLLVLRALGLGDLLTAVPALRGLAAAFPDHVRLLAAPEPLRPLVEMVDAVDDLVAAEPLEPLDPRVHGADVAVNLHGRGPESHRVLLRTRPRRLLAFRHPAIPETEGLPQWRPDEHEVLRWCRLLGESGIPADPGDLRLDPPWSGRSPREAAGATVLHPGAASEARRWPPERWAEVARAERLRGNRVLVTGTATEAGRARAIARDAGLPPDAVVAGRTDLARLVELVAAAGRVVCGDTGVAHLATALGTPSVVLFGPTSPSLWGPPPDERHIALWNGRTGDPHGRRPDPGLLAIRTEDVVAALDRLEAIDA